MSGHAAGPSPAISLVVPVLNEEGSLAALIDSIRRQTRPPDEVILVDGGSIDRTVALAKELTFGDSRFRVIEAGDATPGRGRNVGASAARGEWLAFTDAGIVLEPTWLERLADAAASDPGVEVVYGNYEPQPGPASNAGPRWPTRRRDDPGPGAGCGPFVASMMILPRVFEAAGGFPDLRAAEDLIFMERVSEGGARIGWAPAAIVWWQLQPTLGRTFRKFVLYSKHNIWAGRQADWHYGVARQYLAALACLALAGAHHPAWAAVPAFGLLARVARSVWARREGLGPSRLFDPVQLLGVAMILLTIDGATFLGWGQALARPRPRPGPQPPDVGPARARRRGPRREGGNTMRNLVRSAAYKALDLVTVGRGIPRTIGDEAFRMPARWSRYYDAGYEPGTFAFLRRWCRPDHTAIDIGAHIGLFTVFIAPRSGLRAASSALNRPHTLAESSARWSASTAASRPWR